MFFQKNKRKQFVLVPTFALQARAVVAINLTAKMSMIIRHQREAAVQDTVSTLGVSMEAHSAEKPTPTSLLSTHYVPETKHRDSRSSVALRSKARNGSLAARCDKKSRRNRCPTQMGIILRLVCTNTTERNKRHSCRSSEVSNHKISGVITLRDTAMPPLWRTGCCTD